MVELLVENGRIVTMNPARDVIDDGAIAVDGGEIVAVGPMATITDQYDGDRIVDASGHAVLPGFIDPHTHVADILARGGVSNERALYDWLFNVKKPAIYAMTPDDHAVASALFVTEALRAGITTFVEFPEVFLMWDDESDAILEAKLNEYDAAGIRNVYAQAFRDNDDLPRTLTDFVDRVTRKESAVEHVPMDASLSGTDAALERVGDVFDRYHDPSPDSRQQVWIAPENVVTATDDGLTAAAEFAERRETMTTTHASETVHEEYGEMSHVEYLDAVDYLGDRTVLAHCVHVDERDVRLCAATDTKIVHNPLTNLVLGSGVAPVPTMTNYGVTVGLGTDNPSGNDTINPLSDMQYAALIHRADRRDAGAVTAEKALEMATIDGARTIGRADELGSIEPGKRADLALVDLDYPQLTPIRNIASALVLQTHGHEIDTVVCEGEIVMENGTVPGIEERYPNLLAESQTRADDVRSRVGLDSVADREWTSRSAN
ncbi:amidohydrolase family protein [Halococcus qingdaonensis]|uniref:amidohydrolase family protein n=1 Tax=Halococcus qingdaonensis TaxID=224402 RepID=UPI0021168658|nr:amidohydrolase [Halococcus qingdaonensis]